MNKIYELLKKYHVFIFVVYILALVFVLILKFPSPIFYKIMDRILSGKMDIYSEAPHLIPFETIKYYVVSARSIDDWFFKNLACNILMFVPFGFLSPFFKKLNRFWKVLVSGILVSALIELIQFFTKFGTVDIDDTILNVVGVAIGYALYVAFVNLVRAKEDKHDSK